MSWWNPWARESNALTAAAQTRQAGTGTQPASRMLSPQNQTWQDEAWAYYDEIGEFHYAINWKSEMISRVRLRVGRILPDQDEPEILDKGPAAELINELGGGIGGQSEMLESLATQINVPGEAYCIGEEINGEHQWRVRSADEIRIKRGQTSGYEVIDEETSNNSVTNWRALAANSLVVRIWRPHKRKHHIADSPARSMRPTMRELELVNRKIQAQYLSRLASAGVFLMSDEVMFPVREEFADADDPFMEEWIEIARQAIAQPGSASATVPIPMRVPGDQIDKFKFIDFSIKDDEKVIEKRESAIRRLATQVDVPAEILLGMGDVNHWSAWQLEEGAIKTHISSDVEVICAALTKGYLHPRLKAMGEDTTDLVVWYDTSELTARPNKSDVAKDAYDRLEINGKAYRRELGFDEDDAPSDDELREMGLRKLVEGATGFQALAELVDDPALADVGAPTAPPPGSEPDPSAEDPNQPGPPETKDNPPPQGGQPPPAAVAASADVVELKPRPNRALQSGSKHRVVFGLDSWTLHHPECCRGALMSCPITQASRTLRYYPGQTGAYDCWLGPAGDFVVGRRTYERLDDFLQGHTRQTKKRAANHGPR